MLTVLAVILLILCILDTITTYLVLQYPNTLEANKIFKWVIDKFGLIPSLIAKLSFSAVFSLYVIFNDLARLNNITTNISTIILILLISLYLWVVIDNTKTLKMLRKLFK